MNDVVDRATRSRMMSGIKRRDTKPELIVRSALHAQGFRFRLHHKDLPGKPDLVLAKFRAAIFVNGCFWHGHDCHLFKWPSTREAFWRSKIEGNITRDARAIIEAGKMGWRSLTIWECSIKGKARINREELVRTTIEWIQHGSTNSQIRGRR